MAAIEEVDRVGQAADSSEDELIRRARRSDPAAWETLVREHQEHIFRLAYLTLRDAAAAEDVAQETFIRAYLALDSFELGRPFRPWLTRIAVNLARNRRRSIGRYLKHLRRVLLNEPRPVPNSDGLERAMQARWRADQLWQAVRRLSQKKQEVLYLRYFLAMPEADMAEALDVPPGTIKSRLHRALADLRQVIEVDYSELKELFEAE
jgi:RNA polymerase sigma-70 factor (ECF subfamily)